MRIDFRFIWLLIVLSSAYFIFHGFLTSLLTRRHLAGELVYQFSHSPSVKDAIEACGVPHTEVNQILLNHQSVSFRDQLKDLDQLDIYPYDCLVETALPLYLCSMPEHPLRFILDVHLGKLARRLRLLGFDCFYGNALNDAEIIGISLRDQRIILTCDRGILKHNCVNHGLLIRSEKADEQVQEVLKRYRLYGEELPLIRCPLCNGYLNPVDKETILHLLLPKTAMYFQEFHRCADCGKIYWQGAHHKSLCQWISATRRCDK